VTSDLIRRIYEHRSGFVEGFTKRYGLKRLVYFEQFDDILDAIQREHNMKHWSRAWKVRKIIAFNPDWDDLYETIAKLKTWMAGTSPSMTNFIASQRSIMCVEADAVRSAPFELATE
jgi:putative endonuclease